MAVPNTPQEVGRRLLARLGLPPFPGILSASPEEAALQARAPNDTEPFEEVFPHGAILYHGTSEEAAHQIMAEGFRSKGPIWFSTSFEEASRFGSRKDRRNTVVLQVFLLPGFNGCRVQVFHPHLRIFCPPEESLLPMEIRAYRFTGSVRGIEIAEKNLDAGERRQRRR